MICFSGASRFPEGRMEPAANETWQWANLGKMTAGVAHDFNNLLASISGYAELILSGVDLPGQGLTPREFARNILEAASIGKSTVKELQGLVRREGMAREHLDLHHVLETALGMVQGAMGGRVLCVRDFLPGAAEVVGSPGLLHNVFINLFLNARDAMPDGGTLTVATRREDGYLAITVRDDGLGMTEEVRRGLFRRFETTKGGKGMGLGLCNVLATVESHGGRLEVDSAPGMGTEFRILLPEFIV
jgi:two-component system, cell cycle sensor histidine kinase and response regulator CckA